jgi:hypothetical protein
MLAKLERMRMTSKGTPERLKLVDLANEAADDRNILVRLLQEAARLEHCLLNAARRVCALRHAISSAMRRRPVTTRRCVKASVDERSRVRRNEQSAPIRILSRPFAPANLHSSRTTSDRTSSSAAERSRETSRHLGGRRASSSARLSESFFAFDTASALAFALAASGLT